MKSKLIIALFFIAVAYLCYRFFMSGPGSGMPAPNIIAMTIDGKEFELKKHRGKYIILNFWASWCMPCRAEIPDLIALQNSNKGKFEIVSIALEREKGNSQKVLGLNWEYKIEEVSKFVATSNIAQQYGVLEIPAIYFINPKGNILGRFSLNEVIYKIDSLSLR